MDFFNDIHEGAQFGDLLISPLEGEMAAQQPEGVLAAARYLQVGRGALPHVPHPDPLCGLTLPSRGREGATAFTISTESPADAAARDALLDRAMGPRWRKKSSHKLRRGRMPAEGLALVAKDAAGQLIATVRLWDVAVASKSLISPLAGEMPGRAEGGALCALLLGPLAVDPALKSAGVGSALMRHAIAEACRLGHRAILLVGDAPYYQRFGFSAEKTGNLAMPGPYERERFLGLELMQGALDGASGVLRANGRRICGRETVRVAA